MHNPHTEKPAEIDTPPWFFLALWICAVVAVLLVGWALNRRPQIETTHAQRIHDIYMEDCVKDGNKAWECYAMMGPRP